MSLGADNSTGGFDGAGAASGPDGVGDAAAKLAGEGAVTAAGAEGGGSRMPTRATPTRTSSAIATASAGRRQPDPDMNGFNPFRANQSLAKPVA